MNKKNKCLHLINDQLINFRYGYFVCLLKMSKGGES